MLTYLVRIVGQAGATLSSLHINEDPAPIKEVFEELYDEVEAKCFKTLIEVMKRSYSDE